MTLSRRSFIKTLIAAAAAPTIPIINQAAAQPGRFEIIGKHLILKKTLVIENAPDFLIKDCLIEAGPDFVGDHVIWIDGKSSHGCFEMCRIKGLGNDVSAFCMTLSPKNDRI